CLAVRTSGSTSSDRPAERGRLLMRTYVIKRVVIAGFTLLGMSMLIFFLMRLAPGNITDIIFESAGYVDQADKKRLEVELGFARSIPVPYLVWVGGFLRGA